MKRLSFFCGSILSIFVLIGWIYEALAAPIDELVSAAKKEMIYHNNARRILGFQQ